MKRLLLVCLAGTFLLGVSTGYAQNENLMGFSADPTDPQTCLIGAGNTVNPVHVFISRPVNNDFEGGQVRDVEWVSGFECRAWLEGAGFLLGWSYPVNAVNAGTKGNTVVGFATPIPVIDQFVVVATVEIFLTYPTGQADPDAKLAPPLACNDPTAWLYMAPCAPLSSIVGMMAFLDAEDTDNPLVGAALYGNLQGEDLSMLLEVQPVATDIQSWGGVKALYR